MSAAAAVDLLPARLTALAAKLIETMVRDPRGITEGTVMSEDPAYRRLDCDNKALAYVRTRPRKGLVRVDVSGLWRGDPSDPIHVSSAGATATLIIKSAADIGPACEYLRATIDRTRKAKRGAK